MVRKFQSNNHTADLEIVPKRKWGRPTLLPDEIHHKVMVMVKKIKESRAIINYSTILNISFEFPIWKVGKTQNI